MNSLHPDWPVHLCSPIRVCYIYIVKEMDTLSREITLTCSLLTERKFFLSIWTLWKRGNLQFSKVSYTREATCYLWKLSPLVKLWQNLWTISILLKYVNAWTLIRLFGPAGWSKSIHFAFVIRICNYPNYWDAVSILKFELIYLVCLKVSSWTANSVDLEQTKGTVWSGSSLFAKLRVSEYLG